MLTHLLLKQSTIVFVLFYISIFSLFSQDEIQDFQELEKTSQEEEINEETIVEQGSMISNILSSVDTTTGNFVLILEGRLSYRIEKNIEITVDKEQPDQFLIQIENASLEPNQFLEDTITFDEESILESIKVKERIETLEDDISFFVDLLVITKKPIKPELKTLDNAKNIGIALNQLSDIELKIIAAKSEKIRETKKPLEEKWKDANKKVKTVIYKKPYLLRIGILNASGKINRAIKLAIFLKEKQKKRIEEQLGSRLSVINISNALKLDYDQTTIYFRENYLKSALIVADIMPGDQRIAKLTRQDNKTSIDLEIYLGKNYP